VLGEVVVVTRKIVSKAEGRIVRLSDVSPAKLAGELALRTAVTPAHRACAARTG
jgi:F420-0:gamma-glutamyl ligase